MKIILLLLLLLQFKTEHIDCILPAGQDSINIFRKDITPRTLVMYQSDTALSYPVLLTAKKGKVTIKFFQIFEKDYPFKILIAYTK